MADPTLISGQYSIGQDGGNNAIVYGRSTTIDVSSTVIDSGSMATQDQPVVGHDGQLFGVDTLPGMVVTQTGQVRTPGNGPVAMDTYSLLAGIWNDPLVRLVPGKVQVLRSLYPGSSAGRRTYGRGRKIAPVLGLVNQGLVPWTAQFQSADSIWYTETEFSTVMTTVPTFLGTGLIPPATPPYQLSAQTAFQANTIVNTGSAPTWPVITFHGPVSFPSLTYVAVPVIIGYNGILGSSDTLVIDTRPWARTVLLNGTASVPGKLTGDPMIALQAQPGTTLMQYKGQDAAGTSTCTIRWRNATYMIGGSS